MKHRVTRHDSLEIRSWEQVAEAATIYMVHSFGQENTEEGSG